jgi:hypothetical protein
LARPIIDLSAANAMGFEFSNTAHALVTRILNKSIGLISEIDGIEQIQH